MSYVYRFGSQGFGRRSLASLCFLLPGFVVGLSPTVLADSSRLSLEQDLPPSSLIAQSSAGGLSTSRPIASMVQSVRLNSSAAMVVDQVSGQVLIEKNADAELPIASITKLMTALVVLDAQLPLDEKIIITRSDARLEKNPPSRLPVGARLTRGELLHLALMSSENRAAQALGRSYPGGLSAFVRAMNVKAVKLGMASTRFTEPTGLNSGNVSSPRDLIRLVEESYLHPEIRRYSTAKQLNITVRGRTLQFRNSNVLVRAERWDLGLSKTGFIRDAGRCLVMQAEVESRPVIIVMLDAQGKQHRVRDAETIRKVLIQKADAPAGHDRSKSQTEQSLARNPV
jgi:serine-type D-Ala-D-Ala endopeptidase (penicillin-binding protein 7)